jgi:hypothetical protein
MSWNHTKWRAKLLCDGLASRQLVGSGEPGLPPSIVVDEGARQVAAQVARQQCVALRFRSILSCCFLTIRISHWRWSAHRMSCMATPKAVANGGVHDAAITVEALSLA